MSIYQTFRESGDCVDRASDEGGRLGDRVDRGLTGARASAPPSLPCYYSGPVGCRSANAYCWAPVREGLQAAQRLAQKRFVSMY